MANSTVGSAKIGSPKNRKAYRFLQASIADKKAFDLNELLVATGWRRETATQYLSTRLKQFVYRTDEGYHVSDNLPASEDDFCRLVSRSVSVSRDPLKPQITNECEHRVVKAREAALAAIQNYNNPTATFRTGTYLILMIVAYTSLFHAIFERESIRYVKHNDKGEAKKIAGDDLLWDALESAQYYAANFSYRYMGNQNQKFLLGMIENTRLLLPIRYVFEHRDMPPLDATLAAHCQSMLFNFETILEEEFTSYYSINSSLAITLQLSSARNDASIAAARRFHSQEYKELKQYINNFHTVAAGRAVRLRAQRQSCGGGLAWVRRPGRLHRALAIGRAICSRFRDALRTSPRVVPTWSLWPIRSNAPGHTAKWLALIAAGDGRIHDDRVVPATHAARPKAPRQTWCWISYGGLTRWLNPMFLLHDYLATLGCSSQNRLRRV